MAGPDHGVLREVPDEANAELSPCKGLRCPAVPLTLWLTGTLEGRNWVTSGTC